MVMAWAANTDGCRYVTPATSNPSRIREVLAAASVTVGPAANQPAPGLARGLLKISLRVRHHPGEDLVRDA